MNTSAIDIKHQIEETLKTPVSDGVKLLEPFKSFALKNNLPLKILEEAHIVNKPEIHVHEGDLWYCLEGEVTFTINGTLQQQAQRELPNGKKDPNEITGTTIIGGQRVDMKNGDWLWIPPGQPHQHQTKSFARLIIIKIPKGKGL